MNNQQLAILLVFSVTSLSAQNFKPRPLVPISGHYKTLAQTDAQPQSNSAIDRRHFPLDSLPDSYAKRLKMTPEYLTLPPSVFEIGEFPANSSAQTRTELDFLLKLQAEARTPEKLDESLSFANVYYNNDTKPGDADYEVMQKNLFHIGRQINGFNAQQLPLTAVMMRRVWKDASYYFWALKFKYNRARPYQLDYQLKNVTDPFFQAYPSGHSSSSYVAAYIFQELLPEKTELFVKNAYDMAYSRELLGVHFPSDSEAGRKFARQFVNELLKNKEFQADLMAAKKEVERLKTQQVSK
ncbi:phosphatase PAP2 family protein [Runella sp.]|jgi:acid phosphatase (class A)|uniref:phosphatase PAP2 family protein n=1 Tax=Runella sp. TaxID=1960881 RepID=UPI002639EA16|nr:phosphatase PAP2 family protein [Runella sp.]